MGLISANFRGCRLAIHFLFIFSLSFFSLSKAPASQAESHDATTSSCLESVELSVRPESLNRLKNFCSRAAKVETCASVDGRDIPHVDFLSHAKSARRILVLGLIHGDEPLAGEMALDWAQRLEDLRRNGNEPRNSWRVVPLLNPDGLRRKTRMNAKGVDLNRNFPTSDWQSEANKFWRTTGRSDPRRFPGTEPASEPETRCAMEQIKEFKPDFVVSVHTPYKVLDFDGPRVSFPKYKDLPWRALGNFPGSLGRFMWVDHKTPVLTIELGLKMVDSGELQDIVGSFAIAATKKVTSRPASE